MRDLESPRAKGALLLPSPWSKTDTSWQGRIARARDLADRNPWSREVLAFYVRVLQFQAEVSEAVGNLTLGSSRSGADFEAALDIDAAVKFLPQFASLITHYGPAKLATEALHWQSRSPAEIRARLSDWLTEVEGNESYLAFFPRALVEPLAEHLAAGADSPPPGMAGKHCPNCRRRPQLAVIRAEGDGGKRLLMCSVCHTEWEFRRILCPFCDEVDHEKLPRYTSEGILAVRVEACDTCHTYLKSVDLTLDGHAVPLVDEVASAPLDLWAAEHGYRKLVPNIMGF